MSNFPTSIDDDSTIPRIDDNLSDIGGLAINSIRSALFAVEREVGLGGSGSVGSIAARIAVGINANGSFIPSAIQAAGAIVGPVHDADVAVAAGIQESKIALTYSTQNLYNNIQVVLTDINNVMVILSNLGVDFVRHITGQTPLTSSLNGRHVVSHIDINAEPNDSRDLSFNWPNGLSPRTKTGALRPTNLALFLLSLNGDLIHHLLADGNVHTDGSADQYSHPGASVTLDPTNFLIIPPTIVNVQEFANYVDQTNFLSVTNHQQNMHTNGISRTCRGAILPVDGYGVPVIPYTLAHTFLNHGAATDDNSTGDDIIQLVPTPDTTFVFDNEFSQVKAGQIITVNYGSVQAQYVIDSVRFTFDGSSPPNRSYFVRINGRNLLETTTAVARIDKPLYQDDAKFGVLATSAINNTFGKLGSLLVSNPKGASALGLGFNPSAFDTTHYNLYLQIYPNGNPTVKQLTLPAIDVTGDAGASSGLYTIKTIVESTNKSLCASGYNYRFQAFTYNGEFGIMLADSYNNASFSIISGNLDSSGNIIPGSFTNNVVDVANSIDPLGFGPNGSAVASAQYQSSYLNITQSLAITKIFTPLIHKNYYVNGVDRNYLNQSTVDGYNDGYSGHDGYTDVYGERYWLATISTRTVLPLTTVKATYLINDDLRELDLRPGKTIVIQPAVSFTDPTYNDNDYGRFIIDNITYACSGVDQTIIEVYSAVYGTGNLVSTTSVGIPVHIYISDDSVGVDSLNMIQVNSSDSFRRWFELYVDSKGHTFTHERARYDMTTALAGPAHLVNFEIINVSPKLNGTNYSEASSLTFSIINFDAYGNYTGQISNGTSSGPVTSGRVGTITRFYDVTNIDFIELYVDPSLAISAYSGLSMSLDLFPSLQLDQELFYIASFQVTDQTKAITRLYDRRTFGNVSEKELSTSALDYISSSAKYMGQNGVVRGFDQPGQYGSIVNNTISFLGGVVLVNGKFINVNNFTTIIPLVCDYNGGTPINELLFVICVNGLGETQLFPITDNVSSFGVGTNPIRTLTLQNTINSAYYNVEANTFSNLINTRKDLTPLWLINSSVTGPKSYTINAYDVRKFVTDVNGNDFMVLTNGVMQGNYQSLEAVSYWLILNSAFQNTVVFRSNITLTSNWELPPGTILQGDGLNSGFIVNNYGGFYGLTGIQSTNLTYALNATTSAIHLTNSTFTNCTIVVGAGSSVIVNNCSFINCTITTNAGVSLSVSAGIGNANKFIDCTIINNYATGFYITGAPALTSTEFIRCKISNIFVCSEFGGYSSGDLVNTGYGVIHSSVSIQNLTIDDCIFTTAQSDRFSFVNLEAHDRTIQLQSLAITNNKFYSTASTADIRAVISIVSKAAAPEPSFPLYPEIINSKISNNTCNSNQSIVLTAQRISDIINGAGFDTVNVIISDNTCGVIGFITGCGAPTTTDNNLLNGGSYPYTVFDKRSNLIIENNACKYIANIDSVGQYISFYSSVYPTGTVATVNKPTGNVLVFKNACNWLHVGSDSAGNSFGTILSDNTLMASDSSFLSNFTESSTGITPPNAAIVLRRELATASSGYSIIKYNKILFGSVQSTVDGSLTNPQYIAGLVLSNCAIVEENIFTADVTSAGTYIFIDAALNAKVINNVMSRVGTINAYITGTGGTYGGGATIQNVDVIGNSFDQQTVDGSSTDLILNPGPTWNISNNKNQTCKATLLPVASNGEINAELLALTGSFSISTNILEFELTISGGDLVAGLIYGKAFNLNSVLPIGAKVLNASVTVQTGVSSNAMTFSSSHLNLILAYESSGSSKTSPALANATLLTSILGGSGAASITVLINNNTDYSWTVNTGANLYLYFDLVFAELTGTGSDSKNFQISEITVNYIM